MSKPALSLIIFSSIFMSSAAHAQYGLADGNFEQQGAGVSTYCYFPACPAGAWSGTNGLIHTPSVDWGASLAPSPTTIAFIQMTSALTQTFTATASVQVRLAWLEADRPAAGGQTYIVTVNGTQIGTYTSSGTGYQQRLSAPFALASGTSYTIAFTGQSATEDRSSLIDNVRLVSGATTVSYQYDALGRLIGTSNSGGINDGVSSTYQYDKASNRTKVIVTGAQQ